MAKQVLEIEVPDGKKAIWKNGRVVFEDVDTMESIKTVEDAAQFLTDKRIDIICISIVVLFIVDTICETIKDCKKK